MDMLRSLHITDLYKQTTCKNCLKGFSSSPGTTRCYANPTPFPTKAPTAHPTFEHPAKTFNPTWKTRAGLYATLDISGDSWSTEKFTPARIEVFRGVIASAIDWTTEAVRLVDPVPHTSHTCQSVTLSGLKDHAFEATTMGTFTRMENTYNGYPAYYNPTTKAFLYLLDEAGTSNKWVVADKLGSLSAQLAIKGTDLASLPATKWFAADGTEGWRAVPEVAHTCTRVNSLRVTVNVMPEGCAPLQLAKMKDLHKRLQEDIDSRMLVEQLKTAGFKTYKAHLYGSVAEENCDVDVRLFMPKELAVKVETVSTAQCKLDGQVVKMTHKGNKVSKDTQQTRRKDTLEFYLSHLFSNYGVAALTPLPKHY
jgi:hypothetical protein